MRAAHAVAALGTAFVLFDAGFVVGQQSAPTDYKLVSEDVLAAIDLLKRSTASGAANYASVAP